ncbi:hypothetical protein D9615_007591 [Tricholomella constricta]|uniref:ubiquitinyl hydrolase 1 n=1 Tax=Tricholomella constricta TaxID=117010 RepID=A0A8H5H7L3_9AGAR|nr:hypothetical protein D9615_007591 [Tricholomella constricta]
MLLEIDPFWRSRSIDVFAYEVPMVARVEVLHLPGNSILMINALSGQPLELTIKAPQSSPTLAPGHGHAKYCPKASQVKAKRRSSPHAHTTFWGSKVLHEFSALHHSTAIMSLSQLQENPQGSRPASFSDMAQNGLGTLPSIQNEGDVHMNGPIVHIMAPQYRRERLREEHMAQGLSVSDELEDQDYDAYRHDADDEEEYPADYGGRHDQLDLRHLVEDLYQAQAQLSTDITNGFQALTRAIGQQGAIRVPASSAGGREPRFRRGPKLTESPVRRSSASIQLASKVRSYLIRLVGSSRLLVPSVSHAEAAEWAETASHDHGEATHPAEFRLYILGPPRHPWNRSAAKVFAKDYIRFHQLEDRVETTLEVMEAFYTRLKTLRRKYHQINGQLESPPQVLTKRMRREGRKRTLFHRRLEIAQLNPSLQGHVRILQQLGVDGMSSDESDHEAATHIRTVAASRPTFRVLVPRWRAPEITRWLHVFDRIYTATRRAVGPSRGDYPRHRLYHEQTANFSSRRKFVPLLPYNAYRREWLWSWNSEFVDFAVRPTQEHYPFYHNNDILDSLPPISLTSLETLMHSNSATTAASHTHGRHWLLLCSGIRKCAQDLGIEMKDISGLDTPRSSTLLLILTRWRGEEMRPYQDRTHTQLAFILNLDQHWFTLRRFGHAEPEVNKDAGNGHRFNLNSVNAPERVGKLYIGMVLQQAEAKGYFVFAVTQADPSAPLALPRTEADEIASTLPEPTSAARSGFHSPSYKPSSAPLSTAPSNPTQIEGFEDEDYELQAALQASSEYSSYDETLTPAPFSRAFAPL